MEKYIDVYVVGSKVDKSYGYGIYVPSENITISNLYLAKPSSRTDATIYGIFDIIDILNNKDKESCVNNVNCIVASDKVINIFNKTKSKLNNDTNQINDPDVNIFIKKSLKLCKNLKVTMYKSNNNESENNDDNSNDKKYIYKTLELAKIGCGKMSHGICLNK